jgi:hypothetical protein
VVALEESHHDLMASEAQTLQMIFHSCTAYKVVNVDLGGLLKCLPLCIFPKTKYSGKGMSPLGSLWKWMHHHYHK